MKKIVKIAVGFFGGVYFLVTIVLVAQVVTALRGGQPLMNLSIPIALVFLLLGGTFASLQFVLRQPPRT